MTDVVRFVVGALSTTLLMNAMPSIKIADLLADGVQLIPPASSEFNQVLRDRVDPDSINVLSPILPYAVLAVNKSKTALIGLTIRYEFADRAGAPASGRVSLFTLDNDASRMLRPGEIALIVPMAALSRRLASGTKPMSLQVSSLNWSNRDLFDSQSEISISVDVGIFEDGAYIGPDTGKMVSRFNAFLAADRDLAAAVAVRTGEELKRYLSEISENGDGDTVDLDPYRFRLHAQGASYYRWLVNSGESALRDLLARRRVLNIVLRRKS